METYSGFTSNTPKNLLLDAGAFYKNYDVATDTPATASAKLIGATRGGNEFTAKPTVRDIPVDGVKGKAKGLRILDDWDVSLTANVLEMKTSVLDSALATGIVDTSSNLTYDIVTAANAIVAGDYLDNVTFIGTISGSGNPIIIQVFNALCVDGISIKSEDKKEAVLKLKFEGHYDTDNLSTPPFKIYYPKITADTTAPTVTVVPADNATSVAVGANIVYTFSEAIQSGCITPSNFFVIKASDGSQVPGTLTVSTDKTVVTFDPTSNLTASTAYIAFATTNVKDLAGNALATTAVINFMTA